MSGTKIIFVLFTFLFCRYASAASLTESNHSLYFDWANSLYRYGKDKQARGEHKEAAEKLYKSVSCYAKSLSIRKTLEAWINLGVVLERVAAENLQNQDDLVRFVELFVSLAAFDTRRCESVKAHILRVATSPALRRCCGTVAATGSFSPVRGSLMFSPHHPFV